MRTRPHRSLTTVPLTCTSLPEPMPAHSRATSTECDLTDLFHRLNNQLGIILANAELLESRLVDTGHKTRASQIVSGALEAIRTTQKIRGLASTPEG